MLNSNLKTDPCDALPDDVILKVFSYLPVNDLFRTFLVSKRWNYFSEATLCESKEIAIYNKKKPDAIKRTRDILSNFEKLEKITFIGFNQHTQIPLVRLISSNCKHILEITIMDTTITLNSIMSLYEQFKLKNQLNLRVETRRPTDKFLSNLKRFGLERQVKLKTHECRDKESPWFFEIHTLVSDNHRIEILFNEYRQIDGETYDQTTYKSSISRKYFNRIVLGFPPEGMTNDQGSAPLYENSYDF